MATVKIGNTFVGDGYPCFIIAEIGINHNGDIELAKKLIDLAAFAAAMLLNSRNAQLMLFIHRKN